MYKSKKPYLYGTGRRKSSVARVHLFPNGTGAITINGRDIDDESLTWRLTEAAAATTPDTVIDGHRVRPHIVFFQEAVPMFEPATQIAAQADIFVIIGTSLVVYPAAALLRYVRPGTPIYYIDPRPASVPPDVHVIPTTATEGMRILERELLQKYL